MDTGDGEGGTNWEIRVGIDTLPYAGSCGRRGGRGGAGGGAGGDSSVVSDSL